MFLYFLENRINDKIYIGQTINPNRRFNEHKYCSSRENKPLYNAIRKYGLSNFNYIVFQHATSSFEADELEKYWIEILNTTNRDIGYNLDGGGQGKYRKTGNNKQSSRFSGHKHSDEAKRSLING